MTTEVFSTHVMPRSLTVEHIHAEATALFMTDDARWFKSSKKLYVKLLS